jgi:twitching motility protein PilI
MAAGSGEDSVMAETPLHPFDWLLAIEQRNRERAVTPSAEVSTATATKGQLAVRLGNWNLMFFMDDVVEIIPVPRVTPVPGVKPWLLGIANSRGNVLSVIDLVQFLGSGHTVSLPSSRLLVVHANEWIYGLLVDDVIGMRQFGADRKLSNLGAVPSRLRDYLAAAFESEGQLWLSFNTQQLLNDPTFLDAAV